METPVETPVETPGHITGEVSQTAALHLRASIRRERFPTPFRSFRAVTFRGCGNEIACFRARSLIYRWILGADYRAPRRWRRWKSAGHQAAPSCIHKVTNLGLFYARDIPDDETNIRRTHTIVSNIFVINTALNKLVSINTCIAREI